MVKKGDRIKVKSLADGENEPSICAGDEGTVTGKIRSDFVGLQVFVDFDNGASLTLLPEDDFKVIKGD